MAAKRILIIDDDRSIVELISAIVMNEGYQPTTSDDVETGLMGFRAGLYDLIITDIFMEGVGGIEGIRRVRKKDPAVPIIAISGGFSDMSSEKAILAAKKTGANYSLTKPFTPETLANLMLQALGTSTE